MQKNTKDLANKKKASSKKSDIKKSSNIAKNTAKKAASKTASKSTASKATKKTSTKKVVTSKNTKKGVTKKSTISKASKNSTAKKTKKPEIIEYYDLPYRYNQTVVKILAQTPNTLFVYWDISDEDRKKFVKEFGVNFFENTIPVLIVHNKTMNYSFEIEVNDFANSWYFNVNDAKCDYEIELGRRAKPATIALPDNYMYVASSNTIEAPNNHILFEKNQKVLFFRNVKNNESFTKDISQFEFMNYIGRIYNIYDVYSKIYNDEELQDLTQNPSSRF